MSSNILPENDYCIPCAEKGVVSPVGDWCISCGKGRSLISVIKGSSIIRLVESVENRVSKFEGIPVEDADVKERARDLLLLTFPELKVFLKEGHP